MSQNGQTHFKNLAANCCMTFKLCDYFGTLCIKGLMLSLVIYLDEKVK